MENSTNTKSRLLYLDLLRIIASIGVIILHVAAYNWYKIDVNTFDWKVLNVVSSSMHWVVPTFLMISGTLFLNKDLKIEVLFKKYILRLITAYVVWYLIYNVFNLLVHSSLNRIRKDIISGPDHLWFLVMLIGVYILIPILKKITESDKLTKYFLVLSLIFTFIIPEIITITSIFNEEHGNILTDWQKMLGITMVLGYSSYFVAGYYLNKTELTKKIRIVIYALGLISFVITPVASTALSTINNTRSESLFNNFGVNIMLETIAIFTFVKYNAPAVTQKTAKTIAKLSKLTFGVYLTHMLIVRILEEVIGLSTSYNPLLSVVTNTVIVLIFSLAISIILNKIPKIGKYIA